MSWFVIRLWALALAVLPAWLHAQEVSLDAPATVKAGETFEVRWTGPGGKLDFVTIVVEGAEEGAYGKYTYTKRGNPLKLRAPDTPGTHEVRYLTGSPSRVLARRAITVAGAEATLRVPESVKAGGQLEVTWTGPDNDLDFLTIVPAGTAPKESGHYRYTREGSPMMLTAPETPGPHEVRYLTGQSKVVLAAALVEVTAVEAALEGPEQVEADSVFEVRWSGPGNELDFVAVVKVGAPAEDYDSYAYTSRGNPVRIEAPPDPGDYELRYVMGRSKHVLATLPIRVTETRRSGRLQVISTAGTKVPALGGNAVELILDASGSMLKRLDGKRRIDLAKQSLLDLTRGVLPAGTPFALRVFGHREANSCRTDLEIPLGPLDPKKAAARISSVQSQNLAKTPLARSLALVEQDLRGATGEKIVILVTDGEETCEGDPAAAIESLRRTLEVRVNIVGFAVDELTLKETFRKWAQQGGGSYFDARDAEGLSTGLAEALRVPYEVLDGSGAVVATGAVGGSVVRVPSGTYSIRVLSKTPRTIDAVQVKPHDQTTVRLD